MKHLFKKTMLLCMIFLIMGIPTVFASHYSYYGDSYGYSYSGLNQNPVFVKSTYGSRYPDSFSQVQYLVKNAYGSHYGESYSDLAPPYYRIQKVHNYRYNNQYRHYDKFFVDLRNLDGEDGFSRASYIDPREGLGRYQENAYHPRYIE
mgnify:CR=1 FL=1